jgi:dUTP pyrophosphatase
MAKFRKGGSRGYHVGERIAQLIILPYPEVVFEEAEELSESDRGVGGYGSTGR